jgi:NTP pyrophosphatase (non-canonical NTP hydrolase)
MTKELCDFILSIGKESAMQKMTAEKNLSKPDMRALTFAELQLFLEVEVMELFDEVSKTPGIFPSKKLLRDIQDEAGDVIAFASGIAAKAMRLAAEMEQKELISD